MPSDQDLRVFVLGAGCSYDEQHGYPLAKQFLTELRSFAAAIENVPECKRIHQATKATAELLALSQTGPTHANTIDQLVSLVLNRSVDDQLRAVTGNKTSEIVSLRYQAIRRAKIATAACFLSKEQTARLRHLGKYREFIHRQILGETGPSSRCVERLRKSSARVLSFNYDSLFELAFFATAADEELSNFGPYSADALNSGVTAFRKVEPISKDRFSFVKLHGSVGFRCRESAFGQEVIPFGNLANWTATDVTDGLFFTDGHPTESGCEPLIAFPYEKDFIVSGKDNALSFRNYISMVWANATDVLREATEIWIIGYSFDPTDCMSLVERMRLAGRCKRIVIQNLGAECQRIRDLLMIDYQLKVPIVLKETSF